MAGLAEMAIAIATVLQSSRSPEPLPITLKGEGLEGGATLVRAIIRECADSGICLHKVVVDPELYAYLSATKGWAGTYMEVPFERDPDLGAELLFYRGLAPA